MVTYKDCSLTVVSDIHLNIDLDFYPETPDIPIFTIAKGLAGYTPGFPAKFEIDNLTLLLNNININVHDFVKINLKSSSILYSGKISNIDNTTNPNLTIFHF